MSTFREIVHPDRTALLIVDVQNDFCHEDGHFASYGKDLSSARETLPRLIGFVERAQDLGIRCVFIRQVTLPFGLSDSPAWLRLKTRDGKSPEYTLKGSWGAEFVDGLTPRDGDLVVEKFRPDAFVRTSTDHLLRSNGIESVVVFGTTTEGCVESTIRGASYHDYHIVVPEDIVFSPNKALHDGSINFVKARYTVLNSDELLDYWSSVRQHPG